MATPNARQIVFATSVVPKKTADTTATTETLEDGSTVGVALYEDTILEHFVPDGEGYTEEETEYLEWLVENNADDGSWVGR